MWAAAVTGAQEQAQEPQISEALRTQIESIEDQVRDLRELEQLEPFTLSFPTREDVEAYIQELFDIELTEDAVREAVLFYTAFDLLEEDIDLRQVYQDLLTQQVAGFYDPETAEMNVILTTGEIPEERLPLLEQIVYAHEYVHTLQDQHFDLGALLEIASDETDYDRALATLALIEGDATYVMNIYAARAAQENPFGALAELLLGGLQAGNLTLPPGTPDILADELLWPYQGGEQFVSALLDAGGWEVVDNAFTDLPTTTEQIYHPQKYLDGEGRIPVTLEDASAALGDGWSLINSGTFGEFYLRQHLATQLDSSDVADAATGWGGDRFQLYESDAGERAHALHLTWDSEAEAAEFRELYAAFLDARTRASAVDGCWDGADQVICLTGSGADATIVAAPAGEQARALLEALLAVPA